MGGSRRRAAASSTAGGGAQQRASDPTEQSLKPSAGHRGGVGAVETKHPRVFAVRPGARDDAPRPPEAAPPARIDAPPLSAIDRSEGPMNTPSTPSAAENVVERVQRRAGLDHGDRLGQRVGGAR